MMEPVERLQQRINTERSGMPPRSFRGSPELGEQRNVLSRLFARERIPPGSVIPCEDEIACGEREVLPGRREVQRAPGCSEATEVLLRIQRDLK